MGAYTKDTPVSELSGIGKTRAQKYAKLGIYTIENLINFFPRAYEKRSDVLPLSSANTEASFGYILTVASAVKTARIRTGLSISKFRAFDETGECEIVFFNSPFVKDVFNVGSSFRFYGKASISKRKIQLTNPKYEPIVSGEALLDFVPVYHTTDGLSSKLTERLISQLINEAAALIPDPLPDEIRLRNSLPALSYALKNIHFPESEEALARAISRIAFDEVLLFGLEISLAGEMKRKGRGIKLSPCSLAPFTEKLPYELTASQKNVINDIYKDTVTADADGVTPPMSRIVVGDVGSGKTVCAEAAMYIAVKSGYQAVLMAPTEILAVQHYKEISELMSGFGMRTELLVGSLKEKEKARVREAAGSGEANILVGTHALISDKLNFRRLGLIITDEQHRFGVAQRAVLKERSERAHLLVMSATPIPRTLALALYGDLDVSRITEMPKGRMRVDTYVVNEGYRKRLNGFIEKQVALGGQCYIVCPSIEKCEDDSVYIPDTVSGDRLSMYSSREASSLKNTEEYTKELREALPSLKIDCLHGKMKATEKDGVMSKFANGETDVLVSTTVIEVGVNVPRATLMIVENAERFGLSQLHQLRGRVGRGNQKSYCVLVSDAQGERAKERLEIMRTTYDGYEIAERDLIMRGPGDFFSANTGENIRQSGGFEFKAAKSLGDTELVDKAFSEAKAIAKRDCNLELAEHRLLLEKLSDRIGKNSSLIS